jgi:hypothetical protein
MNKNRTAQNQSVWSTLPAMLMLVFLAGPRGASAEGQAASGSALDDLMRQVERQEQSLRAQQARIDEQARQLRQTKEELERALAVQRADLEKLQMRGAGAAGAGSGQAAPAPTDAARPSVTAQADSASAAQAQPPTTAGQAPESASRPPPVAPLEDAQSALTPRGKWVLEPSLEFATASNDRVALVGFTFPPALTIGLIDVRRVNREFFLAALSARYGLTPRMEVEFKVPYVYRSESTTARPLATPSTADSVFDNDGSGLGDVELGLRYQLNVGSATRPFYVASLRLKTTTGKGPFEVDTYNPLPGATLLRELPTGTGFYALQPAITALLPSDPAVFFGTLSYTWNIKDDVDERDASGNRIGEYDPGDAFNFNFGIGLALNERSSFSVGYEHNVVFEDKVNGQDVPLSQRFHIGRILFGYSYQLSRRANFNLTLGAGITDDAPDVTITARLPILF